MKHRRTLLFSAVFAAGILLPLSTQAAEEDYQRVNARLEIIERKQDEILRLLSEMKEELYKIKIRATLNA